MIHKLNKGDTVTAFNGIEWQKTGDIGDNKQFYQKAEVLDIREHRSTFTGHVEQIVDLKFENGLISNGHFGRCVQLETKK